MNNTFLNKSSFNPMDLNDRYYLVTGAASGIGKSISILLSRLNARVLLIDQDEDGLKETLFSMTGDGHYIQKYDLQNISDIEKVILNMIKKNGRLSGFVHAAGIPCTVPLSSLRQEHWLNAFRINTEAALIITKVFSSKEVYAGGNGSVVFISSVMGLVGTPAGAGYSLTKGALHGMTRSLAVELARKKIRVNCVAPSFVHTPMFEKGINILTREQQKRLESIHPLGIGQPEDIANAVAFLLADTGKWITGTILVVDGGYTAQ
jgi:NAD(P)-dependent dehydrogenase (short-subunit alcohol dehydrogenase family)